MVHLAALCNTRLNLSCFEGILKVATKETAGANFAVEKQQVCLRFLFGDCDQASAAPVRRAQLCMTALA
jgi:hypothetical protein